MRLFAELTKVEEQDDGTIMVHGIASSGARDEAGEIITPDAMKDAIPDFMKWGAIREMHGQSAAGTAVEMNVDADGFTQLCAHVVDPVAITKVKKRTYKGFSVGGKVLARDPKDRTIITKIKLIETSLVDRPCNPEAEINMWKADVADPEEQAMSERQPTGDEVKAEAEAMAKAAGKPGRRNDYMAKAREALIAKFAAEEAAVKPVDVEAIIRAAHADLSEEAVEKAVADITSQPEDQHETLAKAFQPEPVIEADPVTALSAALEKAKAASKTKDVDIDYADPKNKKYPVDTAAHIRAAWSYINMPKNQKDYTAAEVDAIKSKIVAAWKAKIDPDGPPSAEKMAAFGDLQKAAQSLTEIIKAAPADNPLLAKGLYTVARVAHMLECLGGIAQSVAYEETAENDTDSQMPAMASDLVASVHTFLVEMANEEVSELLAAIKQNAPDFDINIMPVEGEAVIVLAAQTLDLMKADTAAIEKAGKRNSAADQLHIQEAHDSACKAGAQCNPDNVPESETDKAAVLAENERLAKALTDAVPQIEALSKRLDEQASEIAFLKAQPMPSKTAKSGLATVEKVVDAGGNADPATGTIPKGDLEKMFLALPAEERAHLAMKAALAHPIAVKV